MVAAKNSNFTRLKGINFVEEHLGIRVEGFNKMRVVPTSPSLWAGSEDIYFYRLDRPKNGAWGIFQILGLYFWNAF